MRIKCPHCNGKGFSELNSAVNMTCGWCMGQGELDLEIVPTEPQTNEEWFCLLSAEEKAKRIINIAVNSDCDYITIVEWLKQPHHQ